MEYFQARDLLDHVVDNLRKSADFWRNNPNDPHGIANGVIASLEETATAIENAIKEHK